MQADNEQFLQVMYQGYKLTYRNGKYCEGIYFLKVWVGNI